MCKMEQATYTPSILCGAEPKHRHSATEIVSILSVLISANQENRDTVLSCMMQKVLITPFGHNGKQIGSPQISHGLMNRRRRETPPFRDGAR